MSDYTKPWQETLARLLQEQPQLLISFDFFDTLATRVLDEDALVAFVFDVVNAQCRLDLDPTHFLDTWQTAVNTLSSQHQGPHFSYQLICDQTFRQMGLAEHHAPDQLALLVATFCQTLIETEANNLRLTADVSACLARLKSSRCILLSDTYYSEQALHLFLQRLGVAEAFQAVFSSADLACSKHNGLLYQRVLQQFAIDGQQMVHVGDNAYADIQQAKRYAIHPLLVGKPNSLLEEESKAPCQNLCLDYFAVSILGPLLKNYISFLETKVSSASFDRIVFLGRDAYLLHSLCLQQAHIKTPMAYGVLSRVLVNQLRFSSLNANLLNHLYTHYPQDGIYALIGAMGLADTDFANHLTALFNNDLKQALSVSVQKRILAANELAQLFNIGLKNRRQELMCYLDHQLGITKDQKIAFVDLGWRGSMADGLALISAPGSKLFLLANLSAADALRDKHTDIVADKKQLHVEALVSPLNQYAKWGDLLSEYRELLEYFCSEPVGSCRYIAQGQPVFSGHRTDSEQKRRVQQTVMSFSLAAGTDLATEKVLENFRNFVKNPPSPLVDALKSLNVDHSIDGQTHLAMTNLLTKNNNMVVPETSVLAAKQARVYALLAFFSELDAYQQVYIYGAGSGCRLLLPFLKNKIVAILDLNADLMSSDIEGIPVKSPAAYSSAEVPVIVSIIGRREQVNSALKTPPEKLYFLDDYL